MSVDLSFASKQWKRTILVRTSQGPRMARRHFEVCIFAALAAALKSGDVALDGSNAYADYREQLLPWVECDPQVAEYCQQVGLPATAGDFVQRLKSWLTDAAERVDAILPSNSGVVITDSGEPVLKRGPRRHSSASAQALEADRSGCAFGGEVALAGHLRVCAIADSASKEICLHQRPGEWTTGPAQQALLVQLLDRRLQGIERVHLACQHPQFHQPGERATEWTRIHDVLRLGKQMSDRHAAVRKSVHRVDAQDGGRAQAPIAERGVST